MALVRRGFKYFALFILAQLVLFATVSHSQTAYRPEVPAEEHISKRESLGQEIQDVWQETLTALSEKDVKKVNDLCNKLEKLYVFAGFDGLEEYAIYLIGEGLKSYEKGKIEDASFYARKALQLSPVSPVVAIEGYSLFTETGTVSATALIARILKESWYYPSVILRFLYSLLYPILWAFTFGAYVMLALAIASHMSEMLSEFAKPFPYIIKGIFGPIIFYTLCTAPVVYGPLWCLLVWAVLVMLLLRRYYNLGIIVGLVIFFWGLAIPLRERLKSWLEDEGTQGILRLTTGSFSSLDKPRLERFLVRYPEDPVVLYSLGQFMRRYEKYDEAERYFDQAREILDDQPWTTAQKGIIAFLRGENKRADKYFHDAEEMGLNTSEFYYNYSKIKFSLFDQKNSRIYFQKSKQQNYYFAETVRRWEEGVDANAVAEIKLPTSVVLKHGLGGRNWGKKEANIKSRMLMANVSPRGLSYIGAFLVLLGLALRLRNQKLGLTERFFETKSELFRLIVKYVPGGDHLLEGNAFRSVIYITLFVLALFLVLGWPHEVSNIISDYPFTRALFAMIFIFSWILMSQFGADENEPEEE